jgi:pyruvate/2-oxoglutarate dehydrogenase complex dihydrolipoamide acyltransferase (E2) component
VKVGDKFREGDILCDITLPVATIGIDAKDDGIVAKIVVDEYQTVPAESVIAMYAISEQYYMNFLAETMQETADAAKLADVAEAAAAEEKQQQQQEQHKPDAKTLMRVIKQMVQHGSIESGSGKLSCAFCHFVPPD